MRKLLLLLVLPLAVRAANPAFQDFNATQFATNGFKVALTNGVIATNLTGRGSMTLNGTAVLTNVPAGTASASGTAGKVPVFNTSTSLVDSAFSSTGTNGSLSGVFSANGGAFSNTLTLSGSTVLTNVPAGTASASGTANTVAKFTSTTNLGNASFTDNGTAVTMTEPLLFSADNTLDIGATNATRPRDIFVGRQVLAARGTNTQPGFAFATATNMGIFNSGANLGLSAGAGGFYFSAGNGTTEFAKLDSSQFTFRSDGFIGFYSTTTPLSGGGSLDTFLIRESAGVFQMGADAATPVVETIKAPDGSGTDKPATNFTVAPGRGTGTGGGGTFYIATAGPGAASASTQNVLTNRFSVDNQGSVAVSNFNGTATGLVGSSASNTLSTVTLGTGLSFSAGTLNASALTTAVTTLAYSGTTNITGFNALNNGQTFILTVTNNCFFGTATFSNLPNSTTNQFYTLGLKMDGTGGYTVGFTNAVVGWADGFVPVIKTNAAAISYIYFHTGLWTNGTLVGTPNLNVF